MTGGATISNQFLLFELWSTLFINGGNRVQSCDLFLNRLEATINDFCFFGTIWRLCPTTPFFELHDNQRFISVFWLLEPHLWFTREFTASPELIVELDSRRQVMFYVFENFNTGISRGGHIFWHFECLRTFQTRQPVLNPYLTCCGHNLFVFERFVWCRFSTLSTILWFGMFQTCYNNSDCTKSSAHIMLI